MDKYTGYDRPINRRIHYLSRIFKEQLRQYGKNILLDNEEVKGIIKIIKILIQKIRKIEF